MHRFGESRSTECSICMEDFRDPRYLPCGHTFCTPCLQQLIDNYDPFNFHFLLFRMLRCPLCRHTVSVPVGGAQGFPRDGPVANRRIGQAAEHPVEGAQGSSRDGPVANRRIGQAAEHPVEGAQGSSRDGQVANRRIGQNNKASSESSWYYYVIVFLIIVLLLYWRFQFEMDKEKDSWSSEKRKYVLSEERLERQVKDLTGQVKDLTGQVKDLTAKRKQDSLEIKRLEKYIDELQYANDPALTKTFELEPAESRAAVAMTLIDGKLLIANSINGDLKLRDAYSVTKETDWATIPSSTVAGMGLCRKNGQVFVSTWNKNIFRFDRNGQLLDQWPVETVVSGVISVTDDCNVVLAVRDNSKKLLIYSTYGEIMNEVEMTEDILESRLIKAVQISNGHFLVSYGEGDDPVHGIAIINANGQTIKSYGRRKGAGVGQLSDQRDFVVDGFGNVLVADSRNWRILLFDSELKFQRELVSKKHGLQQPFGIILNECETLLYVGDNQWKPRTKKWTNG